MPEVEVAQYPDPSSSEGEVRPQPEDTASNEASEVEEGKHRLSDSSHEPVQIREG